MQQYDLRKRLAKFMRFRRGDMALRVFAKKHGLSFSSVSRIEKLEQNVTIDTLEEICKAFRCDIDELFPR